MGNILEKMDIDIKQQRSKNCNCLSQKILVIQQSGKGENKIQGIRQFGDEKFSIEIISINDSLPLIIDNTEEILPAAITADLVLDFLTHPDLSYDLAIMCRKKNIPIVSSGKKTDLGWVLTPPT